MNYRNISLSFWTDSKIDDDFTPEDKYFYLYLLTNPHTNICGCYEISTKQMERETGYNVDTVMRLLQRMDKEHNVIRFSKEAKEVLILNWSKYNWSSSEKLRQAVRGVASHIKEPSFKAYVLGKLDGESSEIPKSSNNENTDTSTQNTENRIQKTESVTDVSIGCEYPIDTVSEKRISKKQISEDFDYLWSLYPKKRGKDKALAAYKRAIEKGETTKEEVEAGIRAYIAYINRSRTESQYIKNGSTYFNGGCWKDDYELTGVNNNDGIFNEYGGISNAETDFRELDRKYLI